jgi:hypothetical protein
VWTKKLFKTVLTFPSITMIGEHMFEKKFLEATLERAVKTFVQTLLALLGTDAAGVLSVDLVAAAQVAGSAALLSVLTSFASSKVGVAGPSLAGESVAPRIEVVEKLVEAALPAVAAAAKKAPAKKAAPKKTK